MKPIPQGNKNRRRRQGDCSATHAMREHLNDSGKDYLERIRTKCSACGRAFESECLILNRKLMSGGDSVCPRCRTFAELPPLRLLARVKEGAPPRYKTAIRLTPEQQDKTWDLIMDNLRMLSILSSNGDRRAVAVLVDTAIWSIIVLEEIADRWPELLRPYARARWDWPGMIGPKRKWLNGWLLKQLEVGKACPTGRWNPKSSATLTAIHVLKWLDDNKASLDLPELGQKTAKQWFEMGWHRILFGTNGKPQEDEVLRAFGRHREKHSYYIGQQRVVTPQTAEANIRDGIKKHLWQAFRQFVPKGE